MLIKREIQVALTRGGGILYPLLFFVIATALFPLALGADPALFRQIGGGIIWVMALLASLLPLGALFEEDREDGMLEQLLLAGVAAPILVITKIVAYWCVALVPLMVAAPLLGLMLQMQGEALLLLVASLLLGTPVLAMVSAIAAALMLGARRNSGLVFLVALPLAIPVVIFGAAAGQAESLELAKAALLVLVALALIVAPVSVAVASAALKDS